MFKRVSFMFSGVFPANSPWKTSILIPEKVWIMRKIDIWKKDFSLISHFSLISNFSHILDFFRKKSLIPEKVTFSGNCYFFHISHFSHNSYWVIESDTHLVPTSPKKSDWVPTSLWHLWRRILRRIDQSHHFCHFTMS